MKWIYIMAGSAALAASAASAEAAAIWNCAPPAGAVKVDLPSGLLPALLDATGDLAMPGEPFDTTDVYVKGHKHGRYLFVWNAGARWIVATEHGGIALLYAVSVYELGKDGKTVTLVNKHGRLTGDVCGTATKLAGR
jgi:hypothetical protein